MKEICKYLLGYLAGFTFFMVLIPFGFYELSQLDASSHGKVFFGSGTLRFILFGVIFLIGAIFAIWSNIFLYTVGKGAPTEAFGVAVSPPTKKLVTDGPYRYTRNPMVFGAFCCLFPLGGHVFKTFRRKKVDMGFWKGVFGIQGKSTYDISTILTQNFISTPSS